MFVRLYVLFFSLEDTWICMVAKSTALDHLVYIDIMIYVDDNFVFFLPVSEQRINSIPCLISLDVSTLLELLYTLPATNMAPEKISPWKFGDYYWKPSFLGAFAVSFRVYKSCHFLSSGAPQCHVVLGPSQATACWLQLETHLVTDWIEFHGIYIHFFVIRRWVGTAIFLADTTSTTSFWFLSPAQS